MQTAERASAQEMPDDYLTVAEVAAEMRCSKKTIYTAIRDKRLKASRPGRRELRIARTDFNTFRAPITEGS